MTLDPLLSASPSVQVHTLAAVAAFGLGAVQLSKVGGGRSHKLRGYVWVLLMGVIAASSLFIHEIRLWGQWSPIHLLSLHVLATLPFAVQAARAGDFARHRRYMRSMFIGALVVAGVFTLLPGRVLYRVLIGG